MPEVNCNPNKTKMIAAICINALIFLFTVYGMSRFFTVGGDGNMTVMNTRCFQFFTVDSNLLAALASLLLLAAQIRYLRTGKIPPIQLIVLKLVGTTAVGVTFFTVFCFLGTLYGYKSMIVGKETTFSRMIQLPSPFPPENLQVLILKDIKTTYQERNFTCDMIARTILRMISGHKENFMVFFPSFAYMEMIYSRLSKATQQDPDIELILDGGHELNKVERIRFQILENVGIHGNGRRVQLKLIGQNVSYLFKDHFEVLLLLMTAY